MTGENNEQPKSPRPERSTTPRGSSKPTAQSSASIRGRAQSNRSTTRKGRRPTQTQALPTPVLIGIFAVLAIVIVAGILIFSHNASISSAPLATATTVPAPTSAADKFAGKQWSTAPAMTINKNGSYTAVMSTDDGAITIKLLPKQAPIAVNSFVFLARQHFYDHIKFHRIAKGFVIQAGDPTGTGGGGPGYSFAIETPKAGDAVHAYVRGVLAMANTGQPNSNGSQFFIDLADLSTQLQPNYTIFGIVTKGMDVADKIATTPTTSNPGLNGENSLPTKDVFIKTVTISGS